MNRFALIGVAGFVAPRHLRAIRDTGSQLVAAVDPHDSVGVLDQYFPEARYFSEIERFDRFLEKQRRKKEPIDWVSICSPNYLHDAHVRLALRVGANAICEKPLVINPWNLDQLSELEQEYEHRVFTVLQLRLHPALIALRDRVQRSSNHAEVCLTYISRRGPWYHASWKGSQEKSGGLAMNIGIHFFDLLLWLFGAAEVSEVHLVTPDKMAGRLELARATVRWFLSVDEQDLPSGVRSAGKTGFRSLRINDEEIDFSEGFTDLHTRLYEAALAGHGFPIEEARPSIELVHRISHNAVVPARGAGHPSLSP